MYNLYKRTTCAISFYPFGIKKASYKDYFATDSCRVAQQVLFPRLVLYYFDFFIREMAQLGIDFIQNSTIDRYRKL